MCSKLRYHVGVGMNSKEREEVLDLCKHISAGYVKRKGDRLRYHIGVGMNSKEREEVLDLCKHISAGYVKRKGDRLMLSKDYWYMKKDIL